MDTTNFNQYIIIRTVINNFIGYLPSSPYTIQLGVHDLILSKYLQNFRCTVSSISTFCIPHISHPCKMIGVIVYQKDLALYVKVGYTFFTNLRSIANIARVAFHYIYIFFLLTFLFYFVKTMLKFRTNISNVWYDI